MFVLSDAEMWLILGLSSLACGAASTFFVLAIVRRAPQRAWAMPLAILGGARILLVASLMLAIMVAHATGASFSVFDDGGGFTLMFRIRDWATCAMAAAVLCLPLELGYLVVARVRGKRELTRTEILLLAPFGFLVVIFLADLVTFVPMV